MDSNMMCYMGLAYENGLIYMHQYGTVDCYMSILD